MPSKKRDFVSPNTDGFSEERQPEAAALPRAAYATPTLELLGSAKEWTRGALPGIHVDLIFPNHSAGGG